MGLNYSCKYLLFEKIGFIFSLSCFSFSHKRCSFSLHLDLSICLIIPGVHSQISLSIFIPCHTVGPSFISLSFSLFVTITLLTLSKPKYLYCPFFPLRFFLACVKAKTSPLSLFFPLDFFWHGLIISWVDLIFSMGLH